MKTHFTSPGFRWSSSNVSLVISPSTSATRSPEASLSLALAVATPAFAVGLGGGGGGMHVGGVGGGAGMHVGGVGGGAGMHIGGVGGGAGMHIGGVGGGAGMHIGGVGGGAGMHIGGFGAGGGIHWAVSEVALVRTSAMPAVLKQASVKARVGSVSGGNFTGRTERGDGQFAQGGYRDDHDRHHGHGREFGFAAGLAAGSALGYGYGGSYDPYTYFGYYDPNYYNNSYAYDDPGYDGYSGSVVSSGADPSYCAQRYKSYDPTSGTYLEHLDHPWKVVPLSLISFQLRRMSGLGPKRIAISNRLGLPVNLFDAMRVVLRKPSR
jgi:hypothetical protein